MILKIERRFNLLKKSYRDKKFNTYVTSLKYQT